MERIKKSRTWSPPSGEDGDWRETRFRFLPQGSESNQDDNNYFYMVPIHSGLAGARFGVICPKEQHGLECGACEMGRALFDAGKKEKARDFWPSWKACVNGVVLTKKGKLPVDDDNDPIVKIVTWCAPRKTWEDLQGKLKKLPKVYNGDATLGRDISNIEHGFDVFINRKGKGAKDTEYQIRIAMAARTSEDDPELPLRTPLPDAIIELVEADESVLRDLTTIYEDVSPETIERLMTPPAAKQIAAPSARGAIDDEDEDDDDVVEGEVRVLSGDEGDDDDEEEEAPPPPPKKAKAPAVPKADKAAEARNKLQEKLKGRVAEPEPDDDDEDEQPVHAFDVDDEDDDD